MTLDLEEYKIEALSWYLESAQRFARWLDLPEIEAELQRVSQLAPSPRVTTKRLDEPTGAPLYGLAVKD